MVATPAPPSISAPRPLGLHRRRACRPAAPPWPIFGLLLLLRPCSPPFCRHRHHRGISRRAAQAGPAQRAAGGRCRLSRHIAVSPPPPGAGNGLGLLSVGEQERRCSKGRRLLGAEALTKTTDAALILERAVHLPKECDCVPSLSGFKEERKAAKDSPYPLFTCIKIPSRSFLSKTASTYKILGTGNSYPKI